MRAVLKLHDMHLPYPTVQQESKEWLSDCLRVRPNERPTIPQLLKYRWALWVDSLA